MPKKWKYNPFLKGLDYYEVGDGSGGGGGGNGGVTTFIGLIDTPNFYTGQAGKAILVNAAENALEFVVLDNANKALSNLENVAVNTDILPDTDSSRNLGSSSIFWANAYIDKIFFNNSAALDGATSGQIKITGNLNMDLNQILNLKVEQVSTLPAAVEQGRIVFLTTDKHLYLGQV